MRMISNCRLLRFGRTQQAYLPRTRDIRDTYGTIAPRKLPLFVPQKFPIIKISPFPQPPPRSSARSAQGLLFETMLERGGKVPVIKNQIFTDSSTLTHHVVQFRSPPSLAISL